MSEEVVIRLELTIDQVNLVLKCLSKQPYEDVAPLINTITSQGEQQIAAMQSPEETID